MMMMMMMMMIMMMMMQQDGEEQIRKSSPVALRKHQECFFTARSAIMQFNKLGKLM